MTVCCIIRIVLWIIQFAYNVFIYALSLSVFIISYVMLVNCYVSFAIVRNYYNITALLYLLTLCKYTNNRSLYVLLGLFLTLYKLLPLIIHYFYKSEHCTLYPVVVIKVATITVKIQDIDIQIQNP